MIASLRYFYLWLTSPQFRVFLNEGMGIEARFKRTKSSWLPHCQNSKRFIETALQETTQPVASMAVLGAGRLFDIDLKACARFVKRISLFDADPSCQYFWPRVVDNAAVSHHIKDITEVFSLWSKKLHLGADETSFHVPLFEMAESDVVVSLNLLSQLPVMWKEQMRRALFKRTQLNDEYIFPETWENLFQQLACKLQREHREMLFSKAKQAVIILSDRRIQYRSREGLIDEGVARYYHFESERLGWKRVLLQEWDWLIAPFGEESPEYEVVHTVEAEAWIRELKVSG